MRKFHPAGTSPSRSLTALSAITTAAILLTSGCASSSDTPKASDTQGASVDVAAGDLSQLQSEFEASTAEQEAISIPPLPAKPEAGKTVAIMTCPLPTCTSVVGPAEEAAKALGWTTEVVNSPLEPEGFVEAVRQIAQKRTDFAIVIPFFPNSFISDELTDMQEAGTRVVEIAGGQTPSIDGPVEGVSAGTPELEESGRLMGVAVANDAKGPAKTLFVWDPNQKSSWQPIMDAFTKVVGEVGGDVEVLDISTADIGKTIPSTVANYLQSHPDITYVAFALSDLAIGVSAGLEGVGLADRVKIVTIAPTEATMANLASGAEWASVAQEIGASGYRAIDQLARLDQDVPLGDLINPSGWHQTFTKVNLPSENGLPAAPGVPEAFLKAWHLDK